MAAPAAPEASSQYTWGVLPTCKNPTLPSSSSEPTLQGSKKEFQLCLNVIEQAEKFRCCAPKGKWYCLTQQPPFRQMAGNTVLRTTGFILPILKKKEKRRMQVPSGILKSTQAGISLSYV